MDYIKIKEVSEKRGVTTRAITYQVVAGRIDGALKKGTLWIILASAQKPEDLRKNNRRQSKKEVSAHE